MYINTFLEKVIGLRKTLCSNLVNTYERKKRPETNIGISHHLSLVEPSVKSADFITIKFYKPNLETSSCCGVDG